MALKSEVRSSDIPVVRSTSRASILRALYDVVTFLGLVYM